mmetsp:Transcript_20474/g.39732  ORF Transcript_20474/g.39732 Transcript_20474/m.39732 type:complete len:123 (-) Transcript_20474:73-441(-)
MAATAAVQRLKDAMDALLTTSLQEPSSTLPNQPLPQATQEALAGEVVEAARQLDMLLEETKLSVTEESAYRVQRDVKELEGMVVEKDALLRQTMEKVGEWEGRFAALKASQAPLLFEPPAAS